MIYEYLIKFRNFIQWFIFIIMNLIIFININYKIHVNKNK